MRFKHEGLNMSAEHCCGGDLLTAGPSARAGCSVAVHGSNMFMFGGQVEDNKKMDDCWCYDLDGNTWSQVAMGDGEFCPSHRSGHSTVVFGSKMYIFGGIYELTHELNDLCVFDFETRKFTQRGESGVDENGPANG